ncbi:hypothetical protein [Cognaticolwellia mytili]|nr:hypothetical protein [Cognaticolwellia mytili]
MLVSHQVNRCDSIAVAASSVYNDQVSFAQTLFQSQDHGELACQ